jgi:hypothetical protein
MRRAGSSLRLKPTMRRNNQGEARCFMVNEIFPVGRKQENFAGCAVNKAQIAGPRDCTQSSKYLI